MHRDKALAQISALAASFDPGEPLRDALLDAPAVRRIRQEESGVNA